MDLGDRTLVFDTFLTPPAARQLREAAIELTGRAPLLVVNSHRHADHTLGNQEFVPEAVVISTTDTRERLRTSPLFEQLPAFVAAVEARLAGERTETARSALAADLADYRVLMAELPGVRRVLADVTFDDRMVLHGTRRRAALVTYGGGHTSSDAFMHLPDDRVALMGDLLFVGSHPGFQHGDCAAWRRVIDEVRRLDVERLIPGHGPVGTPRDLEAEDAYLAYVEELARSVLHGERTRDEALRQPLPAAFADWATPNVLADNLKVLLK